ncbi:hypothetical protein DFH09DRAFT_1081356 [Mycena vulgaris]|nr:hypothetical protein DFH09DRAFT_1081356 [Mycena vulgaris]
MSGSYGWTDTLKGIYYGPGCVATALPKLIQTLGAKKGLIVTGRSLYTKEHLDARARQTDVVNTVAESSRGTATTNTRRATTATTIEVPPASLDDFRSGRL